MQKLQNHCTATEAKHLREISLHPHLKTKLVAAIILVFITLLNLNGLTKFLFGISQAFSAPIFICSIYIIAKRPKLPKSNLAMFLIFMSAYLIFSSFFSITSGNYLNFAKHAQTYLGSILLAWSISIFITEIRSRLALRKFFNLLRNLTIISSISVIFSSNLYDLYLFVPASFEFRNSGFFGDPNEAGLISCFALVLVIWHPFKSKTVSCFIVSVILVGIFLTFSKSAIITAAIILVWRLAARSILLVVLFLLFLVIGLSFIDFGKMFIDIVETPFLNLAPQQAERIIELSLLASGIVNAEVTTHRSTLALLALERAISNFPFGTGLGSFHSIIDGKMGLDGWLGSHNVFLMVWGEAGFLVFVILVVFITKIFLDASRLKNFKILRPLMLVLLAGLMTTTGALGLRFVDVFLGVVIGLSAREMEFRRTRPMVLNTDKTRSAFCE